MQKLNKLVQITDYSGPTFDLSKLLDRGRLAEQIKADIDQYCVQTYDGGMRSHLGASEIGHKCERYLYYKFRWHFREEHNGQKQRLFNRGHREEDRFLEWLQGIGCEILDADDEQTRMVAVCGHFGGSRDGATLLTRYGIDSPLLLEFKTHGNKNFKELRLGGIRVNKPVHWAQVCVYGAEFNIQYCLYFNVNKDNEELFVEVLELDHEYGRAMIEKGRGVIIAATAPRRLSEDPSWYECKWCPASAICHFDAEPLHNCRSCLYSTPVDNAQWECNKWDSLIPTEVIPDGCPQWTRRE